MPALISEMVPAIPGLTSPFLPVRQGEPREVFAERIIGFSGTPGKGFGHEFSGLMRPGTGCLIAQFDLFLAVFLDHGAGTLAWQQTDIDVKDCLITHSRRDVCRQVQ